MFSILEDGCNLDGTLPDAIGAFVDIAIFSVRGNHLRGPLPLSLSAWKKMANFQVSGNQLSGGPLPALPFPTALLPWGRPVCALFESRARESNQFTCPWPAGAVAACTANDTSVHITDADCVGGKPTPAPLAPTPPPPAPPAPTPAGDPGCLERVNYYRQSHGLYLFTAAGATANACADKQAPIDGANIPTSFHTSFARCGEHGQCEAAGVPTCAQAIDLYYNEGPGGGHYKIIMGSLFKAMSWGSCASCGNYQGRAVSVYTHDFFG